MNKRTRTESGAISAFRVVNGQNAIVNYDSNIAISVSNDLGVDDNIGYHGRFAVFKEIRSTPLLPNTELYDVGLVRASVTTNDIPLFCPVPSGAGPVIENGVSKWEVTAQPGLSLTWTGPVFETSSAGGVGNSSINTFASWPTHGVIPFRQSTVIPVGGTITPSSQGVMQCNPNGVGGEDCIIYSYAYNSYTITTASLTSNVLSLSGTGPHAFSTGSPIVVSGLGSVAGQNLNGNYTVLAVGPSNQFTVSRTASDFSQVAGLSGNANTNVGNTYTGRINNMFINAGLTYLTAVQPPNAGSINLSQYLSITNSDTSRAVTLDFTSPATGGQLSSTSNSYTSVAGVLQAAKYFGFAPNSIFVIPPNTTVQLPRPFQLAFRATINVASYKTVRWSPEDRFSVNQGFVPTVDNILQGKTRTYFDCYSYDHFLNQCVNPAIQRCIYDENDGNSIFLQDQCLTRQLQSICKANCEAKPFDSTILQLTGSSVSYNGRAYMWTGTSEIGQAPQQDFPNSALSTLWQDCGPCILSNWIPNVVYREGDVVTYQSSSASPTNPSSYFYTRTSFGPTGTLPPPSVAGASNASWVVAGLVQNTTSGASNTLRPMVPQIGTAAPFITFNSSTNLFTLNVDSYGFGGTELSNCDDGGFTSTNSPNDRQKPEEQVNNSTLNDQARDSWGLTGAAISTTPAYFVARRPGVVFDERMIFECDDYFHQLFGNWPCQRLFYQEPVTSRVTSYVRYLPQVNTAGLSVPLPLPLFTPTVPAEDKYLPYERVKGNQTYLYSFAQNYPSVGTAWNPVDTLLLLTNEIPLVPDQTSPPNVISDTGPVSQNNSNGNIERILGEFSVQAMGGSLPGREYRNEIIFEPKEPVFVAMDSLATSFVSTGWRLVMRMKQTQTYRTVSISDGGSVNVRLQFRLR
jgi:hypothetical protein